MTYAEDIPDVGVFAAGIEENLQLLTESSESALKEHHQELERLKEAIEAQDKIMAELMLLIAQVIPQMETLITHMIAQDPEQEEAIMKQLEENKKIVLDMLVEANKAAK